MGVSYRALRIDPDQTDFGLALLGFSPQFRRSVMAIELFNNGKHQCLMFDDLVDDSVGDAVQANQFLIVDNGHGAIIDPGGNMTYNGLLMEMHNYFPPK